MRVQLVESSGSDASIARAAWVADPDLPRDDDHPESHRRVIRSMLKNRHGSPFESGWLRFYIEAPLFVFREFQRHRIGFSYSETSARYKVLEPEFWMPTTARMEPDDFKPMRPKHNIGTTEDCHLVQDAMMASYRQAWDSYTKMVDAGVAREMARAVLPVGTYSSMYCCCNPRSLLSFLSLRTHDPMAASVSYPQREIEDVARLMESHFAETFPITYTAYCEFGRVAP